MTSAWTNRTVGFAILVAFISGLVGALALRIKIDQQPVWRQILPDLASTGEYLSRSVQICQDSERTLYGLQRMLIRSVMAGFVLRYLNREC